jgi:hypothetical protein
VNDLATLTGQPRPLKIQSKTYWLYPQTLFTLGRFQVWLDQQNPDPEESICRNLTEFAPQVQRYLLERGLERALRGRPVIGSPRAHFMTHSIGGITELLYLSIRRGRKFTRSQASLLYGHLGRYGVRTVLNTMWGDVPTHRAEDEEEEDPDGPHKVFDWWGLFHSLMNDPFWLPPDKILKMTWPQLVCLRSDGKYSVEITDQATYEKAIAREQGPLWE